MVCLYVSGNQPHFTASKALGASICRIGTFYSLVFPTCVQCCHYCSLTYTHTHQHTHTHARTHARMHAHTHTHTHTHTNPFTFYRTEEKVSKYSPRKPKRQAVIDLEAQVQNHLVTHSISLLASASVIFPCYLVCRLKSFKLT